MRKLSAVAAIATCLALSAPAFAAPLLPGGAPLATTKSEQVELVTLAAKIQDDRAAELEDIAAYATKTAKELEAHAEIRDKSASNFEERARKFSDAASSVQDATVKKELGAFAKEMETFAKHDRDFAKERRRASKVFFEEAERAQKWAKGHRDTASRLRAIAEKLKKLGRVAWRAWNHEGRRGDRPVHKQVSAQLSALSSDQRRTAAPEMLRAER